MTLIRALREKLWIFRVLVGSRMLTLQRPDKYIGMIRILRAQGTNATTTFALASVRRPHGVAIVDELGTLTWRDLQVRSAALAVGLEELNEGPVATLAILCRNHRGFVDALIANSRLGGQALLLNTGFSGPQLADVMVREGARVIIYDEEFAGVVADARAQIPDLVEVVGWHDAITNATTAEQLIQKHSGQQPGRPASAGRVVLLTSGTTGSPKGARRSGGGANELAAMLERIPWRGEKTVVVAAPMFHAWGFGQLAIGATMTNTMVMKRRFDPEDTLALVDEHQAWGLSVVPVMLERIIDLPKAVLDKYSLASLKFVSASGSRMRADAVTRFMDRFGDIVHNSYNATEAGQISVAQPSDLRHAADTAGKPVRGTLLRVVDDAGNDVAVGDVGRLIIRGASPFDGYTAGAEKEFLGDFMVSGDVGRLDADGRLYVVGRDDDMIVSGGENVYPIEVEKVLGGHDQVRDVVVLGVDDEAFGQRLAAYVVATPDSKPTAEALKAYVKSHLAGYKVPRDVHFLDELPRNASGKVVARDLPAIEVDR
ncbi:MAG: AMP-binding protein [Aeromicrobium sp.]